MQLTCSDAKRHCRRHYNVGNFAGYTVRSYDVTCFGVCVCVLVEQSMFQQCVAAHTDE